MSRYILQRFATSFFVFFCIGAIPAGKAALTYNLTVLGDRGGSANAVNDAGVVVGTNQNRPFLWDTRGGTGMPLATVVGQATAVSETGSVAGRIQQVGSTWHEAFRWTAASGLERLGLLPDAVFSVAYGINDTDVVVGYSSNASNWNKAFVSTEGSIEELVLPDGLRFTAAYDINNQGVVVGTIGSAWPQPGTGIVFDSTNNTTMIPSGGGRYAYSAQEVTDSGIVAGRADDLNHSDSTAYMYDGTMHHLVYFPGGLATEAMGANDRGDVAGVGYTASQARIVFAYIQGEGYHNLGNAGGGGVYYLTALNDINNHGQMVGVGAHIDGQSRAVLLTPSNFVADSTGAIVLDGGTSSIGGVEAHFPQLSEPGALFSAYATLSVHDLLAEYGSLPPGMIDAPLAQRWELSFTGDLGGPAEVTLAFDESLVQVDKTLLHIAHFSTEDGWTVLPSSVDAVANTIRFNTDRFSPFVLMQTPEPGASILLAMGIATAFIAHQNRSRRARPSLEKPR